MSNGNTLSAHEFQALGVLAQEAGGVEALRSAWEARGAATGRRRRPAVPFRDASQVIDAKREGILTKPEARRLLGLPSKPRAAGR